MKNGPPAHEASRAPDPSATERQYRQLATCTRCPRLVQEHDRIRTTYAGYHASPVGNWGAQRPRLWIVGLAPGTHGAGRTGKAFVGDASGRFLFESLARTGWASSAQPDRAQLNRARITNIVKCVPPENRPTAQEIGNCRTFLEAEMVGLRSPRLRRTRVVVALGGVAFRAVSRTLSAKSVPFAHLVHVEIDSHLHLIGSYHPSRLNVNTGRLTAPMLDAVFERASSLVESGLVRVSE